MAYKFDENKYKSTFDQMYGKGSFDKGISQAKELGRKKVEAEFAKKAYENYLKQSKKKTYDDAVNYWNDPANSDALRSKGVYRTEEDIRNDPRKRQEIKDAGYSVEDFIDGMYNAGTKGDSRSKREYDQKSKKNNQNVPKYDIENPTSILPIPKLATASEKKQPLIPLVKEKKKKDEPFLTDVKNFFTGKDTDKDGKPNGLFKALEILDRPGDAVRTGIKEKVEGGSFWEGAKDGFTGKKDTSGKDLNKALGFDPESDSKDSKIANSVGEIAMGIGPTKLITPFLPSQVKEKVGTQAGTELAGMGSEILLDPLNLVGAGTGKAATKGLKIASEQAMKNILPKSKQVENGLMEGINSFKATQALPKKGGVQNPGVFQDLLPKVSAKTTPDYLPKIDQSQVSKLNIPKIGSRIDELPPLKDEDVSLSDRLNVINNQSRTMPDFSFGKQTSEPNPPVNVYGAPVQYDKVEHAPADYWQSRYEEFVNYVNQNYDTNNLNKEALDDLWTQFARNDEPVTLEQVVDLAYKEQAPVINTSDVWDKMGNRQPASKQAQKLLFDGLKPKQKAAPSLSNVLNNFKSAEQQPLELNPNQLPTGQGAQGIMQQNTTQDLLPKLNTQQSNNINPLQQALKGFGASNTSKTLSANPFQGLNNLGTSKNLGGTNTGGLKNLENLLPRLPETASNGLKERRHIETLRNSQNATDSLKERIKGLYKPTTNEEAVTIANKYLAQGAEKATSFVKSAKVLKPEHVATAHRLIQEFQRTGQIEKAVDIAEHIAEQGTKAGQAVQAFSIFDRLSPEGILVHANRIADRVNAKLSPLQEKVTVTNETAAQLTDLATTVQKLTQQKTVANDVISLMDKAKAGEKLTDAETKQIHQFVDDAKQWIGDITPKKKQNPKLSTKLINPEVKKQIVSFLDTQEEAARKRLAARKNRALSGLPVDDFYDYAVIGASKLAKGTLNLAEFSEQMVREFGQEVAPHVQQIYDKATEMVFNEVKRTTNRLSEVEKITNKALKNGKLEEEEAENLRKFALSINNLTGDAKIEASQELQAVLQGLERPSLLQQISTGQTIGQLLNLKTLGRNAIGNELFYRLERINKLAATPIDIARSKITGGERTVTFRTNNQADYWKNWLRGAKAGWKGVNPEGLTSQYDLYPKSFNGKWNPYTYFEKALGASLKSFDYAGYKRAVNNTIGELATLRATNEGLTGVAKKQAIEKYIREADENVLAIADQYGKYMTFQDNNTVSLGLQKVKQGLNKYTTGSKDFGAGDLIIKYPKTPGSLLLRGLEYSPFGFLKSLYQIGKPILTKGEAATTRDIVETLTRALVGTGGIAAPAYVLADLGILTGGGSKDLDVKEIEKSAGKQEYSLNITGLKRFVLSGFSKETAAPKQGDQFISYNWAQPLALSIAMGANVSQSVKESGETNLGGAVVSALDGALDSMVGLSVLQGVQRALTSYPGQSLTDKALDIAGQLPASFVPTFSNQVRQKSDNTARSTYDPSKWNVFKNQAKNKIPGAEKSLPAAYDTLGNQKEVYQGGSNNLFNVFLNPAFVSKYNPSPEAKMVLDVINETGDTTVAPRRVQKYLMIEGKRYDLTPQQYSDYQRRLGTEVKTQLQHLNPNLPSETLEAKINKILDAAGRKVRTELKAEYRE